MGSMFREEGEEKVGLIIGGVTPTGDKINLVKGGMNNFSSIKLEIIKRRRSGSFCFNRNQVAGKTDAPSEKKIVGLFEEAAFSQQTFIERSNSLIKNHRGFKKKKDRSKGMEGSSSSTELT